MNNQMQYSPKLKKAMEEIKHILKKHDIAGVVVLHTPGHAEFLHRLNPSYSCVKVNGDDVRFRTSLQAYEGDKEQWMKITGDTVNMFVCITDVLAHTTVNLIDFMKELEKKIDIERGPGGFSSHVTQNN